MGTTYKQIEKKKGQVNGFAELDGSGKLPVNQLPLTLESIYVDFDNNEANPVHLEGRVFYDSTEKALSHI